VTHAVHGAEAVTERALALRGGGKEA